jgi:hypothetical protein
MPPAKKQVHLDGTGFLRYLHIAKHTRSLRKGDAVSIQVTIYVVNPTQSDARCVTKNPQIARKAAHAGSQVYSSTYENSPPSNSLRIVKAHRLLSCSHCGNVNYIPERFATLLELPPKLGAVHIPIGIWLIDVHLKTLRYNIE